MKRYRIMKIKEIIQSQIIETQEELANALKKEGIIVTQATVSRDIKDLMLLKIPYGDGHYRYALPSEKPNVMSKSHTAILFQEAVIRIDSAMNMVVLHTLPGAPDPEDAGRCTGYDQKASGSPEKLTRLPCCRVYIS